MPKYTLPELAYDYGALEPHVSGKIMQLHHDKHHAAYVAGANTATEGLAEARAKNDFAKIAALEKALAFHTSGHVLHSLFWQNLAPKAGGEPTGALGDADHARLRRVHPVPRPAHQRGDDDHGLGLGGARLGAGRQAAGDHADLRSPEQRPQGGVPILVLDAWEHAFYLQYGPDKKSFFEAVWNIWNWTDVGQRFEKVRGLDLGLRGATDGQ